MGALIWNRSHPSGRLGAEATCWPDPVVDWYREGVKIVTAKPDGATHGWVAQVFQWQGSMWGFLDLGADVGHDAWVAFQAKWMKPNRVIYRWDAPLSNDPEPDHLSFPAPGLTLHNCTPVVPQGDSDAVKQALLAFYASGGGWPCRTPATTPVGMPDALAALQQVLGVKQTGLWDSQTTNALRTAGFSGEGMPIACDVPGATEPQVCKSGYHADGPYCYQNCGPGETQDWVTGGCTPAAGAGTAPTKSGMGAGTVLAIVGGIVLVVVLVAKGS